MLFLLHLHACPLFKPLLSLFSSNAYPRIPHRTRWRRYSFMEVLFKALPVLDYQRIHSPHGWRFVPMDKYAVHHWESLFVVVCLLCAQMFQTIQQAHTYWEGRPALWVGVGRNCILSFIWQQRTRIRPPRNCWGFVLFPRLLLFSSLCHFKGCYFDSGAQERHL